MKFWAVKLGAKMARYRGPRLKIIRRLGTQLPGLMRTEPELRRPYGPGQHGQRRRSKLSEYALRLREKQKLKFHYGVSEKQLKKYVAKAFGAKGNSGLKILESLERRLDNMVFRAGFATSMSAARQMTRHGHIFVNGKKVDIPSFKMKAGDVITPNDKSKMVEAIKGHIKDPNNLAVPSYMERNDEAATATIMTAPEREDIPVELNEQLIVEYYSGK